MADLGTRIAQRLEAEVEAIMVELRLLEKPRRPIPAEEAQRRLGTIRGRLARLRVRLIQLAGAEE